MSRTRSPLEKVLLAWLALKLVSLVLGYGLTVESLSGHSHASIGPDTGRLIGFVSIGLLALMLLILLAEGRYLLAGCLAAIVVALPLLLARSDLSVTLKRPIPGGRLGVRARPPVPLTQAPSPTARAASLPIVVLFDALSAESGARARASSPALAAAACERMTAAARAELERAVRMRTRAGVGSCERALGGAARRLVFGRAPLNVGSVLSRASGPVHARTADFVVGNGVHVRLLASASGSWRISGFDGGAFAGRAS